MAKNANSGIDRPVDRPTSDRKWSNYHFSTVDGGSIDPLVKRIVMRVRLRKKCLLFNQKKPKNHSKMAKNANSEIDRPVDRPTGDRKWSNSRFSTVDGGSLDRSIDPLVNRIVMRVRLRKIASF